MDQASKTTRPTKKQHETLEFIRSFISKHGYSPSYREIMSGCNYTSVATVALHVNSLIKRGHIIKRDKSARSLEVVAGSPIEVAEPSAQAHTKMLVKEIEDRFAQLEKEAMQEVLDEVYVLVGALKIIGHQELAREYAGKISQIKLG